MDLEIPGPIFRYLNLFEKVNEVQYCFEEEMVCGIIDFEYACNLYQVLPFEYICSVHSCNYSTNYNQGREYSRLK